ncbi:hypothetical protein [Streptomyces stelliscabiei]|uniref:hypothetical protein n=1 Tax=Streptomyces stelliscabiei TaxID=146820 RepID=UPI002FF2E934
MKFVQIIDFEAERIDEMRELDVDAFRAKRAGLVARRNSELALARRCPGRLPVSETLPHSDKEAVVLRDDLIKSMQDLPEYTCPSAGHVHEHRGPRTPSTWARSTSCTCPAATLPGKKVRRATSSTKSSGTPATKCRQPSARLPSRSSGRKTSGCSPVMESMPSTSTRHTFLSCR